ncbi:aminotransferase class I/II-fold pyridoxal phosphate-dependent enzyme [Streptomyces sp. NPDC089919]|uniref:aminotransferase class I/II-fold pyridoxal phosphate-dependent enzyme n=1 Tax=Streptomyces sp. NPDC089919 TaxID=3155188 RepID=UPI003430B8C3
MTLHSTSQCDVCAKAAMTEAVGNPYYPQVTAKDGRTFDIDGVPALLAAGNDYLDLSSDSRVRQAAHDAIDRYGVGVPSPTGSEAAGNRQARRAAHEAVDLYGVGMCGSPLMNGYLAIHHDLEAEIAAWTGQEAALVFTAEDLAVVGPLSQLILLNRDTAVLVEECVADRIVDGLRVVEPRWTDHFRHNDLTGLRALLEEHGNRTEHLLIVLGATEPGTGTSLALASICDLAAEYGAEIFLHDQEGVISRDGATALLGQGDRIGFIAGSLAGAVGSAGGYLATSREMARHLITQCTTRMFAAALPPFLSAGARAGLAALHTAAARRSPAQHGFIDRGIDTSCWDDYRTMRENLGRELAAWAGKEEGVVFAAGYLANMHGLARVIRRDQDITVITDRSSHASMVDGIRLGQPRRSVKFAHNDLEDLERKLVEAHKRTGRALILIEGAYSVEGDLAPLPGIVALAKRFGAEIFLDGAHGVGVVGGGHGTAAAFDLADDIDYITGTFSKAFGSTGGFLLASAEAVATLGFEDPADPALALAPALVAAAQRALDIMAAEPHRTAHAHAMADALRRDLTLAGFEPRGVTPIVSLSLASVFRSEQSPEVLAITDDNPRRQALERARARVKRDSFCTIKAHNWLLSQRAVYTNAFIAPGVDEPVLRLSTTAGFTQDDVTTVVDAFVALREAYRDHGEVPDAPAAGLVLPVA